MFFLKQKMGVCSVRFSGAENLQRQSYSSAEILFSQFFRQSERLICAVAVKGNFLRTVFG